MKFRERLAQINRLQHGLWFKVVASCVILLLGIGAGVGYTVWRAAHPPPMVEVSEDARPAETPKDANQTPEQKAEAEAAKARFEASQATAKTLNDILARKADPTVVFVGIGATVVMALGVVWLGIALTVLGITVLIALVSWPLLWAGVVWPEHAAGLGDAAKFIAGAGALTLSFFILMELLKVGLSGPWAVTAIAKNVVLEALKMKVSIVFIVMMLLGLAALPGLLDDATPLRYRVQSFLQYATGGTFWVIALLTLFLAVGSVAFEQRDRIIWQTMTKPVAPWQYLLGKWLGVVGVAAVLLAVTASGIFLFTGYLRNQRAGGEVEAYIARTGLMSEDRHVLETQVLTARRAVHPEMPELTPEDVEKEVARRVEAGKRGDQYFDDSETMKGKIREDIREEFRTKYLTLEPGQDRLFAFRGMADVKRKNLPITLRYRVSIGADDPRGMARVSFEMPNVEPVVREVPLGQSLTLDASAASIEIVQPRDKEGKPTGEQEGVLWLRVTNGDLFARMSDPKSAWANKDVMTIPPDGLEVSFPVGGYEANFLRVVLILWLKLAFLAMVGVWAATYLSFAVASLIAFGTFLIAETAGFLSTSLEYFNADDGRGHIEYWKVVVRLISLPIAGTFKYYAELRPTANLVDGRLLGWGTVGLSAAVLGVLILVLYGVGVLIFRRRELAMYSGQ